MAVFASQPPVRRLHPNSPAGQSLQAGNKPVGELALEIRRLILKLGKTPYIELRPPQTEIAMRERFEISERLWGRMETFESLQEKARDFGKSDSLPFFWDPLEADEGRLRKIAEGLRGEMQVLDGLLRDKTRQQGEFRKIPVLENSAPSGEWDEERQMNLLRLALAARAALRRAQANEGWDNGLYRSVDEKIKHALRMIHNIERSLKHYAKHRSHPDDDTLGIRTQADFCKKGIDVLMKVGMPLGKLWVILEKIVASAPKGKPPAKDGPMPEAEKAPIEKPASLQAQKPSERETIMLQNAYACFGGFHRASELEPGFIGQLLNNFQLTENAAHAVWGIGKLAIKRDLNKLSHGEYERNAVKIIRGLDRESQEQLYFYGTGIHSH